ncbi:hypothetical protein L198_05558 [Cryptococcus wingfieldii CBS 7118]|uniref:Uncharacterized protein n=1 Tax=Cryptococcus wingfieldii CBS 7118 TaxID=1295528 RepID=A0A1E3IVW5_9TREE|nr:hypothetical protein L198_05558 [Cryptococcus wingfieldii CBS 7118]ODN92764.1 hypothetical protein L198_05558 [Cryptococcus wingfieldii CBS 7118]
MQFVTDTANVIPPKNLYPCLATISLFTPFDPTSEGDRRSSFGSFSDKDRDAHKDESGNALTRILSGSSGRRKSTAVDAVAQTSSPGGRDSGVGRRRRFSLSGKDEEEARSPPEGRWYWRVRVGVTDSQVVLLPLSDPANPLLTSAPPPLSTAVPSHAAHSSRTTTNAGESAINNSNVNALHPPENDSGIANKMKNFFRRGSTTNKETSASTGQQSGAQAAMNEPITDQTASGATLPCAAANEAGATDTNGSSELAWPGVIDGDKLAAVIIPTWALVKDRVQLKHKKAEGTWVIVQVKDEEHHPLQAVGSNRQDESSFPKSGTIKFEFDKDWIGAKDEAELLQHHIQHAVSNALTPPKHTHQPAEQAPFQLGSSAGHVNNNTTRARAEEGTGFGAESQSLQSGYGTRNAQTAEPVVGAPAEFGSSFPSQGAGDGQGQQQGLRYDDVGPTDVIGKHAGFPQGGLSVAAAS